MRINIHKRLTHPKLLLQLLLHELCRMLPEMCSKHKKVSFRGSSAINVPLPFDLGLICPPSHPLATPTSNPLHVWNPNATELTPGTFTSLLSACQRAANAAAGHLLSQELSVC
jgi:hypothetical protein